MPDRPLRRLVLRGVYHEIAMIEDTLNSAFVFNEMPWTEPSLLCCLAKYSKITILHFYCFYALTRINAGSYMQDSDLICDDPALADDLEGTLAAYGVPFTPYKEFDDNYPKDEAAEQDLRDRGYYDTFRLWYTQHYDHLNVLWDRMADDIFYILFANRPFLLKFNTCLANILQRGSVPIPQDFLDEKGVLKRQAYIPHWAKTAVYCRDHGRCVLCQKDLSNLLSTDRKLHYDHMVPLNLWGTNDPCNLQLLCEDCNLKKSGTSSQTAAMYPDWWS